jgi:hypothetical protein
MQKWGPRRFLKRIEIDVVYTRRIFDYIKYYTRYSTLALV